ncbi:FAD-dependent oxidoreductase [Leucobacter allii]|uniref:FAD-dependent oxidoreductase n=1 Tax=Leucobacter allii TaxID=2932247 RepID=A0ABY4FHT0_9MICO|nr:NAD(P)/FAD-dependent oxidoreductase [Leucobacter allii]UOQ55940.1 FAD-dependent oxidoreductase [Leucobacter allii]
MERFDTIVVGAGVAGLTAARLLAGAGAQRVLVLEARERVGGRTWSERADGVTTDVGASWIHGIDDNPLAGVTKRFGMRRAEFTVGSYQPDGRPIADFGPAGERLSPEAAARFAADVHGFDERLAGTVATIAPGSPVSYADAVERTLDGLRAEGWDADRAERVREFLRHRAEEQYGVAAERLDAHGLDDDQVDGDEVVFPDGYDALAHGLAEGLDIRLGHVAALVEWGQDGAIVTSDRGAFAADRVVVTVPVGVLRAEDGLRFEPPLPEPVAGALGGLEMNDFEKVFLRFPERFWEDGVYAIRRQGPAAAWWHSWYDLTPLHGVPTLLTFAAGPCARATRDWSDERIAASVLAALRELYGDRVPEPSGVRVSRWRDDPFARGSYAFMTVGSRTEDHDLLATPLGGAPGSGGVLHLAGEATWTEDPATVTAALRSGHRAAERILGRELPFELLAP